MISKFFITTIFSFFFCLNCLAQENTKESHADNIKTGDTLVKDTSKVLTKKEKRRKLKDSLAIANPSLEFRFIDPLAPARAAFYSAILPGLGQAYNRKYWKIPIVYLALGTGIYFYVDNNNTYNSYRDAYKSRLAGFTDDQYQNISDDGLIYAQEQLRKNMELSLLITFGLYVLNIVDANVDAHLLQFNIDDDLSLSPHFNYNEIENTTNLGLSLNFKF